MCGAFPIDRENPGAEAIKYPVNMLKKSNRSLIMFPSGSRHSQDVKGGVAIIAKMAEGPYHASDLYWSRDLKGLATGERIDMNFGHPIDISDIKKMNDEGVAKLPPYPGRSLTAWMRKHKRSTPQQNRFS